MCLFKTQRILLAWYYSVHNVKLVRLHVQLAERQSRLLDVHKQAQVAGRALQELQLERAQLHQRLERVADHAKIQVGQLAVANDRLQSLQHRDEEHQLIVSERDDLSAALAVTKQELSQAQHESQQSAAALVDFKADGSQAAAAAQDKYERLEGTCVNLQRHLSMRKATMDACVALLQAAGHR